MLVENPKRGYVAWMNEFLRFILGQVAGLVSTIRTALNPLGPEDRLVGRAWKHFPRIVSPRKRCAKRVDESAVGMTVVRDLKELAADKFQASLLRPEAVDSDRAPDHRALPHAIEVADERPGRDSRGAHDAQCLSDPASPGVLGGRLTHRHLLLFGQPEGIASLVVRSRSGHRHPRARDARKNLAALIAQETRVAIEVAPRSQQLE